MMEAEMRIVTDIGLISMARTADKKETGSVRTPEGERLLSACQGFEAIILRQLLAAARPQEGDDGLFGRSFAREMYDSMKDEVMAARMARAGGIGLADSLYRRLSSPAAVAAEPGLDGVV